MSDTRTYIVPDGQENSTNQMLPWMAMMNGGMGGFGNGMWNNPFMYLVWMWMMRWMNRGEWGDGDNCQKLQSAEIQGQLAGLREKNSQQTVVINNAQQTAAFGQMISQATTPIVAAVNALQGDVNGIKCKLPETVTLPYSCATAVPTQAVFNGYALGTYAGWNGCGCNNSLWG